MKCDNGEREWNTAGKGEHRWNSWHRGRRQKHKWEHEERQLGANIEVMYLQSGDISVFGLKQSLLETLASLETLLNFVSVYITLEVGGK